MTFITFIIENSINFKNGYDIYVTLIEGEKNVVRKLLATFYNEKLAQNYKDYLKSNFELLVSINNEVNTIEKHEDEVNDLNYDYEDEYDSTQGMLDFFGPAIETYDGNEDAFWDSYKDD